jgi:hypothetical protein
MERAQAFSLASDLEDKGFDRISLWSEQMDWTVALRIHGLHSDVVKEALNTVELHEAQVASAVVTASGSLDIN